MGGEQKKIGGLFKKMAIVGTKAAVTFETYGGETVKRKIEEILEKAPADHIIRQVKMSQGKRNKNKWGWAFEKQIDKFDPTIVDWYKETFLAFYTFLEPEVAKNL